MSSAVRPTASTAFYTELPKGDLDVVIEQLVLAGVVALGQPKLRHCHPDRIADASAQWSGRGFDPGGFFKFWVARANAADLSERFDGVERNGWFIRRIACLIDRFDTG